MRRGQNIGGLEGSGERRCGGVRGEEVWRGQGRGGVEGTGEKGCRGDGIGGGNGGEEV